LQRPVCFYRPVFVCPGGGRRRGYGRTEPLQGIQPIAGKPPGSYAVPQLGHNKVSPQQMTQVNYLPQYQHNN